MIALGELKIRKISIKVPILFICFSLILWYMISLATFLVKPPSNEFSNPSYIGSVEYGAIKNMKTAVVSEKAEDGRIYVAAIDGIKTHVFVLNKNGELMDQMEIDLNMKDARHVEMDVLKNGILHLYYLDQDLHEAYVDVDDLTYYETVIQSNVRKFNYMNDVLIIQTDDALILLEPSDNTKNDGVIQYLTKTEIDNEYVKTSLVTDAITSYGVDSRDNTIGILYTTKVGELNSVIYSMKDNITLTSRVVASVDAKYISTIEDVMLDDQQIVGIFSHVNKRFEINTITAIRFQMMDLDTNKLFSEVEYFQHEFSIQKGAIKGINFDETSIVVLLQDFVEYGVNLVRVKFETNKTTLIEPLTKSKYYSVAATYYDGAEIKELIFSDRPGDERKIFYASSSPQMVKSTSELRDVNVLQLFVVTILVIGMSVLPSIATYLLKTALVPMLLVLIGERLLKKNIKARSFLLAAAGIIQIAFVLNLSFDLKGTWSSLAVLPIGVQNLSSQLFVLIVISMLILFFTILHYFKDSHFERSILPAYGKYLVTVYFAYIVLIVSYIYTELIISKV